MAKSIDIRVLGDQALERKLKRLVPKLQKKILRKAMRKAIRPVLAAAKEKVPVDTGALRDSLKIRAIKPRRGRFGVGVVTGKDLFKGDQFYGAFVELGTKKQPARPFLRPALKENEEGAKRTLRREIGTELEREAKQG